MPHIISYKRIPRDHQSTFLSYPLPLIISGARYSGVPQKELVFSPGFIF